EHLRLLQVELGDDVAAHLRGGGGGVGVDAGAGEELAQPAELAVFGAKVVAPVADAVGLVDGEGAHADRLQGTIEVGLDEALRRARRAWPGLARGGARGSPSGGR